MKYQLLKFISIEFKLMIESYAELKKTKTGNL